MKKILLLYLLFFTHSIIAQDKFSTSKGTILFEASVAFFTEVAANNNNVSCILYPKKNQLNFLAYITDFNFERSLMQEHFNDNYLESHRYPKASFKGIIEKFDVKDINSVSRTYYLKGKIYIHGKSKNIRVPAQIKKVAGRIAIKSDFVLNTDDFKIKIPFMVENKVSKEVKVTVNVALR